MLSNQNLELVKRDRELPGLALLLDPEAFAAAWSASRGIPRRVTASIDYIRYKPGRRCIVLYSIDAGVLRYEVVATAHNWQGWSKHVETHDASACDTNPSIRDELSSAWVSAGQFPCDRKLRLLQELRTPALARNFVRSFVDRDIDDSQFRLRRVAYKPARRAVYEVNTSTTCQYALKFFDKGSFEQAKNRTLAWERCRRNLKVRGVKLPKLIRANPGRRITVTRWLRGGNLAHAMLTRRLPVDVFQRVGFALGELHEGNPHELKQDFGLGHAGSFQRLADDIGFMVPRLADSAKFYAQEIHSGLSALPNVLAPIHGDFYAKQICVSDRSIGILDFDQSILSDPRRDVGNFIAKLIWNSHRGDFEFDQVEQIEAAFLCGYASRRGPQDATEFDLHVAAGLFKCVTHPFRCGMEDWPTHAAKILEFVEERLDRCRRQHDRSRSIDRVSNELGFVPSSPSVRTPSSEPLTAKQKLLQEVATPWIANALTAERATRRLVASCAELREHGSRLEVERAEPIRHKPGRRCLIRYDIRVAQSQSADLQFSVIGKTRFKGVDRHSYHVQSDLWRAGLSESNPNGIAVPKPLGIDPSTRTWFQEFVPGESLEKLASTQNDDRMLEVGKRTASALVALHDTNIDRPLTRYTPEEELASLCKRLRTVAILHPNLESAIIEVISHAIKIFGKLSDDQHHGIHRDFYPSQVLATPDRIYLLDFDLYCQGPRTLDAGNYLGHLWELSIRFPEDAHRWRAASEQFISAYRQTLGERNCQVRWLNTWAWMTLARHIWISTQILSRSRTTADLIDAVLQEPGLLASPAASELQEFHPRA